MPAMTMPFDLEGQEVLEELRPGDEVEGTLVVGPLSSELVDLIITRPALPEPVVLDNTSGSPSLRPRREPLTPGQRVPDFTVTTQEGRPLSLSGLRGSTVALTFIYTRCPLPEFCPLMDQKFRRLAELVRLLPEARERSVRLLSISFDPEHDTPEVLARHARLRGAEAPLWTFAVASHDELRKVSEPLGLLYGPTPDEIVHNLVTAVIGPDGRLVRLETGGDWTPEELFRTIADQTDRERSSAAQTGDGPVPR